VIFGPRRNRMRELAEYEERLVALEQRRAGPSEEITAVNLQLRDEPARHTAALAQWMQDSEEGDRPAPRIPELEAAIADRQAEYEAAGRIYDETLRQRAGHVARNRDRLVRDVRKEKERRRPSTGPSLTAWHQHEGNSSTCAVKKCGWAFSRPRRSSRSRTRKRSPVPARPCRSRCDRASRRASLPSRCSSSCGQTRSSARTLRPSTSTRLLKERRLRS
jgi:hypothetical protein